MNTKTQDRYGIQELDGLWVVLDTETGDAEETFPSKEQAQSYAIRKNGHTNAAEGRYFTHGKKHQEMVGGFGLPSFAVQRKKDEEGAMVETFSLGCEVVDDDGLSHHMGITMDAAGLAFLVRQIHAHHMNDLKAALSL